MFDDNINQHLRKLGLDDSSTRFTQDMAKLARDRTDRLVDDITQTLTDSGCDPLVIIAAMTAVLGTMEANITAKILELLSGLAHKKSFRNLSPLERNKIVEEYLDGRTQGLRSQILERRPKP